MKLFFESSKRKPDPLKICQGGSMINILLVEDNEGDIILTIKALKKADIHEQVQVVTDGEKAIRYLKKEPPYENAETPDLILLDINLPKVNGKEVLLSIKKNTRLAMIPVVVLTTSQACIDIKESYSNHANCFITKPSDFNLFLDVVKTIKKFWIDTVRLPNVTVQ